jgi:Uma2 family endonuclease
MEKNMAIKTLSRLTTYDDYRQLPDDGKLYQIIGGELYMAPAPTTIHQRISLKLLRFLDNHITQNNLGEVLYAPVDVVLSMTDVVQPDLIYVAKERLNIITKKNIVDAPDLVVEILSEHTETIDRQKKMALFEKHGVKKYWIVDPAEKTIEQFVLEEKTLQSNTKVKGNQKLTSIVVHDFSFPVSGVFE